MGVNGENPAKCWKFISPKNELFSFCLFLRGQMLLFYLVKNLETKGSGVQSNCLKQKVLHAKLLRVS